MQPNNNQILTTTNKASEAMMRGTVVDLLEDAIALCKDGATPDQVQSFLQGICVTIDAARSLGMAHTGEGGRVLPISSMIGAAGVASPHLGALIPNEMKELEEAYDQLTEVYESATEQWEEQRREYLVAIEQLQDQVAQLSAPKNGHRTVVESDYEDEGGYEDEELASAAPKKATRRVSGSSRERVREMLSNRRLGGGRGFGRNR